MNRKRLALALAAFAPWPALAEPPAPPQGDPVVLGAPAATGPRTLADVARGRKLNREGPGTGTFSVAASTAPSAGPASSLGAEALVASQAAEAKAAQARMDRALRSGQAADHDVRGRSSSARNKARAEWDAAAENCRKTPGCRPTARSDGAATGLKTDAELTYDLSRRLGLSGARKPD